MPLIVNLRHLEAHSLKLEGELPAAELELDIRDELIQANSPLEYHLEVQMLEDGLLVQGSLWLELDCECARCLKSFIFRLNLNPWTSHLPLEGEEKVTLVNDFVDLTPYIREDILLEFPQHPLCEPECRGLPKAVARKKKQATSGNQPEPGSSAWAELNKLKF